MTAIISFLSGESFQLNDLAGSGLGFYGSSYGDSVEVGEYQDSTWITNSTGNAGNSIKVDNVKFSDANNGELAGADVRLLREIPNYLATLNIRLTNSTPVKCQNPKLRIYDRSNLDNPAVGVTTKVALLVHGWNTQMPAGSGSLVWSTVGGSGSIMDIGAISASAISPSMSGSSPSGANSLSAQHDWYMAISASPDSIGSKTSFGLGFSVEFI